jgi:hypothetical protein
MTTKWVREWSGKRIKSLSRVFASVPGSLLKTLGFELPCCCILSCVSCTAGVISSESIGDVSLYVTRSNSNGAFLC